MRKSIYPTPETLFMAETPLGNLIENELKEKEARKIERKRLETKRKAREDFYKNIIEEDSKQYTVFHEHDEERIFVRKVVKEKAKAPSLQRQYGQTLSYNLDCQNRKDRTPPKLSRGMSGFDKISSPNPGQNLVSTSKANNSGSLMQSIFKK